MTPSARCSAHSTQTECEDTGFLQALPGAHALSSCWQHGKLTKMLTWAYFAWAAVFRYYQGKMVEQTDFTPTTKAEQGNYQECCCLEAESRLCICLFPPASLSPEAEVGWKMQETFGYIKRIWFISHSAGISWHNLCSLHRLGAWLVALFLPLHAVPSVVQDCDHQCELPLRRLLVRRQLHPL